MEVAEEEKNDLTWRPFAFVTKKRILKIELNSSLGTLPTKSILLKSKKSTLEKAFFEKARKRLCMYCCTFQCLYGKVNHAFGSMQ